MDWMPPNMRGEILVGAIGSMQRHSNLWPWRRLGSVCGTSWAGSVNRGDLRVHKVVGRRANRNQRNPRNL